jgi:hypothetical protein
VKPANVLLDAGGRLKLSDFGLARSVDDASPSRDGQVVGTPMYMSPEQVRGDAVDHRSDLFSLGSVLYFALTGLPPFRGGSGAAVLDRVTGSAAPPLLRAAPRTPAWLAQVVARLHAKAPDRRYQSARQVAEALAAPPTTRPARWLSVAATAAALLVGLGVSEATGVTRMTGTVVRLFTPDGTLVIETDDAGVSVAIDGEELTVTGAGVKELRVRPGQYKVEATRDGKLVTQRLVTVTRNGKEVVRITREPPPAEDADRRAATWLRSLGPVQVDVAVGDNHESVLPHHPLPADPFRIVRIYFPTGWFEGSGDSLIGRMAGPLAGTRPEGLNLANLSDLTTDGVAKLVRQPAMGRLTYLAIRDCRIDDRAWSTSTYLGPRILPGEASPPWRAPRTSAFSR